jgi:hypothetical protein
VEVYLERKGVSSLEEIRGNALKNMTHPDEIIRWSGEPKKGPRNVWNPH